MKKKAPGIRKALKEIQKVWRDWRKEVATEKALQDDAIKERFGRLVGDNKKFAKTLESVLVGQFEKDS